jgi:hypothetical protein
MSAVRRRRIVCLMENLRINGASEEEIAFMFRDLDGLRSTRRVELNAMTSPQFVSFIERKLRDNGIVKIVPDEDLLAKTYIGMERGRRLGELVAKLDDEYDASDIQPPTGLEQRVREVLEKRPWLRWDAVVESLVDEAP